MRRSYTVVCPACGERLSAIYLPAWPGTHADPPEPASWDWLYPHGCRLSLAQQADILAAIEAQRQAERSVSSRLTLAELPR